MSAYPRYRTELRFLDRIRIACYNIDGVENGEEEIFPDALSESVAESWRNSAVKALERQFASYLQ